MALRYEWGSTVMLHGRRTRARVLLTVWAALPVLALQALSAAPAAAEEPVVSVVDVPRAERWSPREADVLGANDAGFLYLVAGDAGAQYGYTARFRTYDGSSDAPVTGVAETAELLGDRIVQSYASASPRLVHTTVLGSGEWQHLQVPDGTAYVGATEDGMLTATSAVPLQVTPWDGGDPVPVDGLPSGTTAGELVAAPSGVIAADAHAAVVRVGGSSSRGLAYVDTALRRAWVLPDSDTSYAALGPGRIAWFSMYTGADPTYGVAVRPQAVSEVLASTTRPGVAPDCGYYYGCVLTVLADGDLLVSRRLEWQQYSPAAASVVQRVSPDGSLVEELGWGHGVVPVAGGGYLVVSGTDPAQAAIRLIQAPGDPGDPVIELAPVPERVGAVALDGTRLVTLSDAAQEGSVRQRSVDVSSGVSPGSAQELATGSALGSGSCQWATWLPCGPLAAEHGTTAWPQDTGQGVVTRVRSSEGALSSLSLRPGDRVRRVSGPTLLGAGSTWMEGASALYDIPSATKIPLASLGNEPLELSDGVAYWRSPFDPAEVAARDLATGASASFSVHPDCGWVGGVQVAGAFLLAACSEGYVLLDRRSGTASVLGDGPMWLGNGFVVRAEPDPDPTQANADLSWTATDDVDHAWHVLPTEADVPLTPQLSAARDGAPLVAWVDWKRQVHLALLPVETTPTALAPVGATAPPGAPTPAVTDVSSTSLTLGWPAAPSGEEVRRYTVVRQPGDVVTMLPGDATGLSLTGLQTGTSYTVTVKAESLAGSAQGSVVGTPKHDTPVWPTNVQAAVDPITSRVTVSWSIVPDPQFSDPLAFRVQTTSGEVLGHVDATARSASLVAHQAGYGQVLVYSVGAEAEWPGGTQQSFSFPGDDKKPPVMTAPVLPPVLTAATTVLRFAASDDRRVRDYQVAERVAATGRPLGAWTYPASWSHLTSRSLTLSSLAAGSTHCYAVRARDDAGNVSAWSRPACTTVALDDRSWGRATSGWATSTSTAYYLGSATATSRASQVLRRAGTRADAMTLVVTRCPTCGSVGVYDNGVLVAKVSLYASTTVRRALLNVPFGGRRSGVLSLKTLATGKLVVIDGVALRGY